MASLLMPLCQQTCSTLAVWPALRRGITTEEYANGVGVTATFESRRHCACMHSVAQHGARFDLVGAVTKVFEDVDTSWHELAWLEYEHQQVNKLLRDAIADEGRGSSDQSPHLADEKSQQSTRLSPGVSGAATARATTLVVMQRDSSKIKNADTGTRLLILTPLSTPRVFPLC